MLHGCGEVRIRIDDADVIAESLKPDDVEWCESFSEGELVLRVKTPRIGAMMNAFDDYFLNIIASKSVLQALKK
jgi:hypothetical protein